MELLSAERRHLTRQPYWRQFSSDESSQPYGKVVVRNTFLDEERPPSPTCLRREKTAPALLKGSSSSCSTRSNSVHSDSEEELPPPAMPVFKAVAAAVPSSASVSLTVPAVPAQPAAAAGVAAPAAPEAAAASAPKSQNIQPHSRRSLLPAPPFSLQQSSPLKPATKAPKPAAAVLPLALAEVVAPLVATVPPMSDFDLERMTTYDSYEDDLGNEHGRNATRITTFDPFEDNETNACGRPTFFPAFQGGVPALQVMTPVMIAPNYWAGSRSAYELMCQQMENHQRLAQQYELMTQAQAKSQEPQGWQQIKAAPVSPLAQAFGSGSGADAPAAQYEATEGHPWIPGRMGSAGGQAVHSAVVHRPAPQTLFHDCDKRFSYWTIDARKLKGTDRVCVSPAFHLPIGKNGKDVQFKMMLTPSQSSQGKGGNSFRRSKGFGHIQLKCEAQVAFGEDESFPLQFRLCIGSGFGGAAKWLEPRGFIEHDFLKQGIFPPCPSGPAAQEQDWDFLGVVDEKNFGETLVVALEVCSRA